MSEDWSHKTLGICPEESTDDELERDALFERCLKAEAERDMARQELKWESEASNRLKSNLRRDMIRAESALQAAAKRNETIARLARECAEAHRELIDLKAKYKSERANHMRERDGRAGREARAYGCAEWWQARGNAAEAIANEAMAAGLAAVRNAYCDGVDSGFFEAVDGIVAWLETHDVDGEYGINVRNAARQLVKAIRDGEWQKWIT